MMQAIDNRVKEIQGCFAADVSAEVLCSEEPIILRGFAKDWSIVKEGKLSIDQGINYILNFYAGENVRASYLEPEEGGRVFYNEDMSAFNYESKELGLKHVFDDILEQSKKTSPATIYVASTLIDKFLPGLQEEIPVSPALPRAMTNIWIGGKAKIAAHYDFPQNLACSVIGRRRFTLFPPEQGKNLYPGPLDKAPGGQEISTVDFDKPDFDRFPKFKTALEHACVAELEAGDALVLPSMWWHHVEGLDDLNVLVTHWWRDTPAYLGRPTNALLLAILSLRDLPSPTRDAWKALFDHYVFEYDPDNFKHIPDRAQNFLASPLDELNARKLRADLQNKLRR